jgi:hypothetical protein
LDEAESTGAERPGQGIETVAERDIETWTLVLDGIRTLGVIVGACWVFWRFRRERVDAAQIEFTVDANLLGPSGDAYAAEYVLTFENKGKTRVEVTRIELKVRGIKEVEPLKEWSDHGMRLEFPNLIVDDDVIPTKYKYAFFEPGIRQEYRYVSKLPATYKYISIRGIFFYREGNSHSAEKVMAVGERKSH